MPHLAKADDIASAVAARQAQLQAQLNQINAEIAQQTQILTEQQSQQASLERDIAILQAEIKKSELDIKARDLNIQQLSEGITEKGNTLVALDGQLGDEEASLAQILRNTNTLDHTTLVEFLLAKQGVSSFFSDLDSYASIQGALQNSFTQIQDNKTTTTAAKTALEDQRTQEQQLETLQKLEEQKITAQKQQEQSLLTATKGIEANYQQLIAANQKTAAQIRTELFALAGGGGQIPFPTAITLATEAGKATGVRPALILAVLKQETNLGQNVGQCLLTNVPNKGDGKGKNTGTQFSGVMKPTRDVDPFMAITASLGLDPYSMPVSCPPSYGYGGAMGPGQFIPSTWVLLENHVASLAGHPNAPANPWDNLDAFTATALLMADNGASSGTASAERTAALKYFAGGNYTNPAYGFYGDSVMSFAADFQSQIDILKGS